MNDPPPLRKRKAEKHANASRPMFQASQLLTSRQGTANVEPARVTALICTGTQILAAGLYERNSSMSQQPIVLIPLREGLNRLLRCKSSYYEAIRPESPRHDPDLPLTVAVGSAPNSPRAFVEVEIDEYLGKLVARARASGDHAVSTAHAKRLVAARQSRRASTKGE